MVSVLHEALVEVFRDHPHLLVDLVGRVRTGLVPPHDHVESVSADLGSALPRELRADGSLRFDRDGSPVLTLVFEVQLNINADKSFVWPAYLTSVRLRDRCDALVVVITVDRAVAAWARRPIRLGPESSVQPLVIGPDEVPAITDLDEATRDPELATLSALAHARDQDEARALRIAASASIAALELPDGRGVKYYDLILACLSEAARKALQMLTGNYQLQDEGLRRAWTGGEAKGKAEGRAEAILRVLEARCIPLTAEERARFLGSTDLGLLDRWLVRSVTASSVDEVFAD